jgi:hypothetical protein
MNKKGYKILKTDWRLNLDPDKVDKLLYFKLNYDLLYF